MSSAPSPRSWRAFLGLNASTMSLLGAILLVTAATELWSPLVPQYLKALQQSALHGDVSLLITIGLYGFYRDGLEALNYYAGGAIAGRFNSRRALLFFNFLPLVGLGILFAWKSTAAVFLAIPFIFVWDSIAGPATITVVGDSLDPARRTMAFSMQSIFKRASRILAYLISAPLVAWLGRVNGLRADVAIAVGLILLALIIQTRFMRTASRDESVVIHRPLHLLRSFPTDLKRLLAADILSRWAEGLAGPFVILYCVPILSGDANHGTAMYQSVLLTIQAVTNIVLYLVVGPLASREGLAKKPFIGWTFVFFAAFPVSLILLGPSFGMIGLAMAFVIGGFREIGEPARKAMIADLVPREVRTQAVGLYWSARGVCVMWAAPVGALCWIAGNRVHPGAGPVVAFSVAGFLGLVGAVLFALRFGRAAPARPLSASPAEAVRCPHCRRWNTFVLSQTTNVHLPPPYLTMRSIVIRWTVFLAIFVAANRLVRWIDLRLSDIDRPPYWPIGVLELCRPSLNTCLAAAGCLVLFSLVIALLERCRYRIIPVITGGLALIVATNSLHGISSGFAKPIAGADGLPRIQYYDDALRVDSPIAFVKGFNKAQSSLLDHARTHPPGAVVLIYSLNSLLGDPARIALTLAMISTLTIAAAVYFLVRRGQPATEFLPGFVTFAVLLLPAVQIYALASIDAVIAGLVAASIAFFLSPRTVPSLIGCTACLFIASTMTFAALFLPPVLLVSEWVNRRRWNRTACVVAVTVILHLGVFCLTGFDYVQGFRMAALLENQNGFRLLHEPLSFTVTRVECIAEILLFLGPIAMAMITGSLATLSRSGKGITLAAITTLLAMFATGAFHTAETARACLFIVPFLAMPMMEWSARWCVTANVRWRLAACLFGQSLVMQFFGDFFW